MKKIHHVYMMPINIGEPRFKFCDNKNHKLDQKTQINFLLMFAHLFKKS